MLTPTQTYVWPTPQHELLLKTLFLKDDAALAAWEIWHSQRTDKLDVGSQQLLPLLYRKLLSLEISDSRLIEYKAYYQRNWAKNHALLHKALPALQVFQTAGIETWVLKGTAMILLGYEDLALRPMVDCDILVERHNVLAAIKLLLQSGWHSQTFNKLSLFTPGYFLIRHAHSFANDTGGKIDLHWRVFNGADIPFKAHSLPVNLFEIPSQSLSFTDLLFHTCVHGVSENVGKKLLWICDAMFILQKSSIDWSRLVFLAEKFHLSLPLYDTLMYLHDRLQAPIPNEFFSMLNSIPVTKLARNEYRHKTHPKARSLQGTILRSWHQHARLSGFRNFFYRLMTFPRYLQLTWGLDAFWKLPLSGVRIVKQRFL